MTIQGAVYELEQMLSRTDIPDYIKPTIEKVIETIIDEFSDRQVTPQTDWIPVGKKLPMNGDACCDDDVLVSCEDGFVRIGFCMGYDELGNREWCISADKYAEVVAWMPLPQPYKVESEDAE